MKPIDMFWEAFPDLTRGEAQELLAELVLIREKDDESDCVTNGLVCDALAFALNRLWAGDEEELNNCIADFKDSCEDEE